MIEDVSAIAGLKGIDREIAAELHVNDFAEYGPKVERAFRKVMEKPGYSRFEALDRELSRAREEEDFLLVVAMM